uniref:Uncharacterized protein n=1 Tax=Sander lucioperca TaxID=283035 RepID=A0A8C9YKB9_SANLU
MADATCLFIFGIESSRSAMYNKISSANNDFELLLDLIWILQILFCLMSGHPCQCNPLRILSAA